MCNVEFGRHGFNVIIYKKYGNRRYQFEVEMSDFTTSSFSAAIHVLQK